MGGKTKHTQRTKNNAKPSSSSAAALALGTAAPTFVGFSALADRGGLVPFAPGFASAEQMAENFDPIISPQFQIILRKLIKKDPMTKKKAVQEFIDMVKESDKETMKAILPLWPKYYLNLANDPEHSVREITQSAQQLLVSESKRAVAPYLKQLVPVWLASQFDNYAPAASIASNSFRETFASTSNRTQEVCLHCQAEILEFATRNLTFHTAASMSIGKSVSPEDAEAKYQRALVASLKMLCFFVENTVSATDQSQILAGLQTLLEHQKFWSYSKHKVAAIKAAWFEFIYHILQSSALKDLVEKQKSQLITTCFQNIDDADPLIAPNVWGCVLLLQTNFTDWYAPLNIRKALLPKLTSLLHNGCNRNAQAVCPNLLPFFAKIDTESLQDVNIYEFYKKFFDELKYVITTTLDPPLAKSDYAVINKTYFECLRFLTQKLSNTNSSDNDIEGRTFAHKLIEEYLLEPIALLLRSEDANVKHFFQHTAALVAFCDRQSAGNVAEAYYAELLNIFWTRVFALVTEDLTKETVEEHLLSHVLTLVQDLYAANPSLEDQKVKFSEELESTSESCNAKVGEQKSATRTAAFIQKELKQLVIKLVRICLNILEKEKSTLYVNKVRQLTQIFADAEFFESFTDEKNLSSTLQRFVRLLGALDKNSSRTVIDIIFEILDLLPKTTRFEFIEVNLLKLPQPHLQNLVLQRLLSYPLCIEPKILELLATPTSSDNIARIANEVVYDNDKEKFNLLHKCFFQTETGQILINAQTVDAILLAVSAPLEQPELNDMVDVCGSFIAQIMPVICSNNNSSRNVQNQIFLRLYKFSLTHTPNDFISEDTLWELTTCWQDALSSQDIVIDESLLPECAKIVETHAQSVELNLETLDATAEAMAKFITCSTEHIKDENKRSEVIDKTLLALFTSPVKTANVVQDLFDYCLYLEGLKAEVTVFVDFPKEQISAVTVTPTLKRTALNFATLLKLVCKVDNLDAAKQTGEADDEITEDFCDPNENLLKQWSETLLAELQQCINIASSGDGLINVCDGEDYEDFAIYLSEKVRTFMANSSEVVDKIKERMLAAAISENSVIACRSLLYFVHSEQYALFEENATILLHEELAEQFVVTNKTYKAYVNILQYLLPKLAPKTVTLSSAIMRTEPPQMWVKAAVFRALILNNFNVDTNEMSDRNIIVPALQFITDVMEKQATQKDSLLYNIEIHRQSYESVINTVEYINLLNEMLQRFPYELTIKHWDAIRVSLSSWVLSVSKSIEQHRNPKNAFFIVAVYKLFATLISFIRSEKQKSSTLMLKNVIDEWENLFARDGNVIIFKSYYILTNSSDVAEDYLGCYVPLLAQLTPALELVDYSFVYAFCKNSSQITLDNLCNYLLRNLASTIHTLRWGALFALRQLTQFFVVDDIEVFEKNSDSFEKQTQTTAWHYLNRFEDYIARYDQLISKYLTEFSFKLTELSDLEPIDVNEALSFLLLWDCIIYACANSPVSLRSVYTNWLNEHKYEEKFLHFLFRAMPVDILKNHSAKVLSSDIFKELSWSQLKEPKLPLERYVCHLYTEVLRKLPAVVRKWWNTSASRQKNFVDNLTTHYVSALICNEELKAIANRKEKHENMQVTVHTSTREVLAVYAIDEARMELVITLAQNYPLGAVKVECGKQIGGRASSRNVGMQLTIFLTHQNGTIYDGLTMWKNNLDKKFEGVEECYVCYTVIHQDTCQLPKLTCKTCKKKFHGPCLYKWFTTSSKSTCPICRNIF